MIGDEADDLRAHVEAVDAVDVESIQQRERRLDARLLMVDRSDPPVDHGCRRRLAEVMADGAEHHRRQPRPIEVAVQLARLVDHHQRVDPHVPFGMPLRLLLAADERTRALAADGRSTPRSSASVNPIVTDAPPAAAASRLRPRSARPAGRRAGFAGTAPRCRPRARTRSARRTARPAARAGCRHRTCARRPREGGGVRDRRVRRTDPRTRRSADPTRWR